MKDKFIIIKISHLNWYIYFSMTYAILCALALMLFATKNFIYSGIAIFFIIINLTMFPKLKRDIKRYNKK